MFLTDKLKNLVNTRKCGNSGNVFIDQLPSSITEITAGCEDRKTVVAEVRTLDFVLLLVDVVFTIVNMQ